MSGDVGISRPHVVDRPRLDRRRARSMGGPTRNKRLERLRLAENAAREAQRKADVLACEAWNERMTLDGGPAQPSPSIRAALNAGYRFLRVRCSAGRTRAYVDLGSVRRRPAP